jgi:hypothetical protein
LSCACSDITMHHRRLSRRTTSKLSCITPYSPCARDSPHSAAQPETRAKSDSALAHQASRAGDGEQARCL